MRDVGDKVATHGLSALALGDVLRQHELQALAIGPNQHGQAASADGVGQRHRLREVANLQVLHKDGRAHEVGHALLAVAHGVQAKVVGGHGVAPLDFFVSVEQQHTVG